MTAGLAGACITGARCMEPVKHYDKPGRNDFCAVCWRPAGHRSDKHLSKWAYLRELRRASRRRNARRRRARQELAA